MAKVWMEYDVRNMKEKSRKNVENDARALRIERGEELDVESLIQKRNEKMWRYSGSNSQLVDIYYYNYFVFELICV